MVKKIILTRPAVEAGEVLVLPGDLKEKIDPYLRPLYDTLDDMIPADKLGYYWVPVLSKLHRWLVRGRTLDNAFIILDEAQNATDLQLKMFLTRIGCQCRRLLLRATWPEWTCRRTSAAVLKKQFVSCVMLTVLLMIAELDEEDVVRHRLVKKAIIKAYERERKEQPEPQQPGKVIK